MHYHWQAEKHTEIRTLNLVTARLRHHTNLPCCSQTVSQLLPAASMYECVVGGKGSRYGHTQACFTGERVKVRILQAQSRLQHRAGLDDNPLIREQCANLQKRLWAGYVNRAGALGQ